MSRVLPQENLGQQLSLNLPLTTYAAGTSCCPSDPATSTWSTRGLGAAKRRELGLQDILDNSGSEYNPKLTQHDSPKKTEKRRQPRSITSRGYRNKEKQMGLPWWSSGEDSELPVQGAWVPSPVGELRSCMPHRLAKIFKIIIIIQ